MARNQHTHTAQEELCSPVSLIMESHDQRDAEQITETPPTKIRVPTAHLTTW